MRIAFAQMNPVVGDFEFNLKLIEDAYVQAVSQKADLLITPELSVCGYPPHDLLLRPEMLVRNRAALERLAQVTAGQPCALAVGHVDSSDGGTTNKVTVLSDGKSVFSQAKRLLPTYDVFDEHRYFAPGGEPQVWEYEGLRIAFAICEDLWKAEKAIQSYSSLNADLLVSLSASPYEWGKRKDREAIHGQLAGELKCPLLYVNQVGSNDEILFDGGSFISNPGEDGVSRLPLFEESFGMVEWQNKKLHWLAPEVDKREDEAPEEIEVLSRGLVLGIRDYFRKTGFKKAVLGLSGGIDSALVATLCVRALGAKNVTGILMSSQYSSAHSFEDAEVLAKRLGMPYEIRPIKFLFSTMKREWSEGRGELSDLAQENLQARIRGTLLMTIANHENALVMTTGNKSELAVGYCTLYGDMVGAIDPIGDLFKTRVYELSRWVNENWDAPIPERSIEKAPSAELKLDQKDTDSLPDYDKLDPVLGDYVEGLMGIQKLLEKYPSEASWIPGVLSKVEQNEYKRRQSAIVLKVSSRAFGVGRRVPVAKKWNQVESLLH